MQDIFSKLKKFFEVNGESYELDSRDITIKPILNWGGFENISFSVSDGRKDYHLKLSREPSGGLELFFRAAGILEARYRSPKAYSWIEIPGTGYSGILFESIHGSPVKAFSDEQVREVGRLLQKLQKDQEIKKLLANRELSCFQTYLDIYNERYIEDLKIIENSPPPFVSKATFNFMAEEASKLKELVMRASEFKAQTDTPVHTDIWSNNLLVDKGGSLFLIDWDGLAIGDPSLDYAMLLGPGKNNWRRRLDPAAFGINLSPDAAKRIVLYHRAMLLDWVIDPLADWIEVARFPDWAAAIRSENEENHSLALKHYRELYIG